jgi:hypothetical protein
MAYRDGCGRGICKNLVKDRMERSGMHWTRPLAEAMLKLRAIYLSGDCEEYWALYVKREHAHVPPPGYWCAVDTVDTIEGE